MNARAAWLCVAISAPFAPAQDRPPNIVLIMADDIGYECFGSYGGTSYRTPRLDALAERGMRFTHCYSQPLCTPSRVKIMTGQSNIRNYVSFSVLGPQEHTFGHLLRGAGYRTAVAGKWQLYAAEHYAEGIRGTGMHPRDSGFDAYCLWQVKKLGSRYWGPAIDEDGRFAKRGDEVYGPDEYCAFLLNFMERHKDQRFFAYFPMALVHNPFVPTPGSEADHHEKSPEHFGAMVTHMDAIVGRIADKVAALGIAENTLILFTTDNGTNRKIRSQFRGRTVRGGKGLTTDAGTRVPLIAYWPGTVPAGAVCEDLVDFSDFFPTFAELGRAQPPAELKIDGQSFAPQLRGEPGQPREWIFCFYHPRPITRAKQKAVRFARNKRWKLYGNGDLFDVTADPMEKSPVAPGDQGTADAKQARRMLRAAIDSMPDEPQKIGRPR